MYLPKAEYEPTNFNARPFFHFKIGMLQKRFFILTNMFWILYRLYFRNFSVFCNNFLNELYIWFRQVKMDLIFFQSLNLKQIFLVFRHVQIRALIDELYYLDIVHVLVACYI